jgi:hypothetical protein
LGHFYTNRDGVVSRYANHEITRQTIYQRLAAQHNLDSSSNPFGYIAIAHYASGVSRLLKRPELQEVVRFSGLAHAHAPLRDAALRHASSPSGKLYAVVPPYAF